MKLKQKVIIIALIPLIVCNVNAQSIDDYKTEYNELQKKEETQRAMLELNYDTQNEIKEQIAQIDDQLSQAAVDLKKIDDDMLKLIVKIDKAQEEYDAAALKRANQNEMASKRIRYMYENGQNDYFSVLFNLNITTDYLIQRQYISDIMEYDAELLDELEKIEEFMKNKLDEITRGKEAQEVLKNFKTETELKMAAMYEHKNALLEKYADDAETMEAELAEIVAASDKVKEIILNMEENSDFVDAYTGGQLEWPVEGRYFVSSDYVGRMSPVGNGYEFHTGIDIPAPYGYDIIAAEDGVVAESGWINGYGNTVIINHGNGLCTLYGHNSELVVSAGDTVERGQVIARCGSTGYATGDHCHFEVRLNGEHVSPWGYLEKKE